MAIKQKGGGGAKTVPVGLAISWAVQIVLTALLCFLLTALILGDRIGKEAVGYGVPAILMISAYAGAAAACKLIGHHYLIVCLSSAALYLGTLLAIALLLFDAEIGAFWVAALVVIGASMAALLICSAPKRSRSGRQKMRRM